MGQPVRDNAKKRKTAKLLYFNARSILSKLDLLQLHVYDNKPELIAVCESFTNSDIGDALLGLEGYELISRKDGRDTTNGKCRGLLIYAKIGLQAMHCPVPREDTVTEISSIKIPWGRGGGCNQEFLQVVLVYRPPRVPGSKEDGGNTEQLYKVLGGLNGNVVVVGDFNLPSIDWERNWAGNNREEGLVDLVENKFWSQHVLEPTHEDGNTLDLCLSSQEDTVAGVEILEPLGNGDHNMLDIDLAGPLDNNDSVEEVPDWEKADITQLTAALHEVDWDKELRDLSGTEAMDRFYEVLDKEVQRFVPKKLRRKGSKPLWMNRNIMRMIRRKRRLWRSYSTEQRTRKDFASFQAFKKVQKEVEKAVKAAKRKLERSLAKNSKRNPKAFYSYIKKKSSNRVTVGPLKNLNGKLVTDDKEMADILNSLYCSMFTREDMSSIPTVEVLHKGEDKLTSVKFTKEKVSAKLRKLKPTSAPGPDKVWTRILHDLAEELAGPLAIIYTRLMEDKAVPDIWLWSHVCPIFKKGSKSDPGNYRPVSLTCVVGKVMESIIVDALIDHMITNQLLRSSQHGFLPGKSTTTCMLEYLETLTRWVDEGMNVDVLYCDFAKAFDKVPWERLLAKMEGVGVGGNILGWVRAWLTGGRQQRVVLNGQHSSWGEIVSGVIQGSCLGPALFLIFINDIDTAVDLTASCLIKFADDTKWAKVVETEDDRKRFQEGVDGLEKWSKDWQLLFNISKCKIMHMGGRSKKFSYTMDGEKLVEVDVEKDVGVLVASSLKPSQQCSAAAGKANGVLGQISRAVKYRDRKTFIQLYKVYVRPHLEYCIQAWSPYTKVDKEKLEKVQKRAVKMVAGLKGRTYEEKLKEVGLTSLEDRRERGDMIQTFKIIQGLDQVEVGTWFTMASERDREGASNTRHSNDTTRLEEGTSNLDIRRNFFSQRVPAMWNSLPQCTRQKNTVLSFKAAYDGTILRQSGLP